MSGSTSTAAAGAFRTSNGQIIGPNGQPFVAAGVNVMEGNQPSASTLQSDFPGINFVRLAIYDFQSPGGLSAYVNELTSAGLVVELEDHSNSNGSNAGGASGNIFTGQQLSTELNWYSSVASAFANNPNVWFGTNNEPSETNSSGNQDPAALSAWQQQTYAAVRDAGNSAPVLVEINGGGSPSTFAQGYTSSVYAGMTNIVGDVHYYGWVTNYSTDQATVSGNLAADIAQTRQVVSSADGTLPIIIGEFGNSTNGSTFDANGDQVITAVQQSGAGTAAWAWGSGYPADGLTVGSGSSLSDYGRQIAAGIAASAKASPSAAPVAAPATPAAPSSAAPASAAPSAAAPSPTAPAAPAAADNATLAAGATGSLVDASGNAWTIANGVAEINGAAAGYSANVSELASTGGAIWQENADNLWWEWNGTGWGDGAGTSTSPLPTTITLSGAASGDTVSQSQVAVQATSGDHLLFISGSGDSVSLSGGANTITDTGHGNTYVLPAAANGTDTFTSDITATGDTLDLTAALAATDWNGSASTLPDYVTVADTASAAVLSVAPTSGGIGVAVATIDGASTATLASLLPHLIT